MPRKKTTSEVSSILEELVRKKYITQAQASILSNIRSFSVLEEKLTKSGWVDEEEFAKMKARFFNLPYINLIGRKVDPEVVKILPKDFSDNYKVAVFDKKGKTLSIAIYDPTNLKAREALEFFAREGNYKIKLYTCSKKSFEEIYNQYSALKSEVEEFLGEAKEKLTVSTDELVQAGEHIDERSAPIAKMVDVILRHAVEENASDIHIEPMMNKTRVRYRIDGVLKTSLILPKYVHSAIVSRIKVMARLKIDETRIPQDGRIRVTLDGKEIDFRISTLPLYRNEKVVMRILDSNKGDIKLEDLGFEGKNLSVIKENIKKPHGMFLVTGPTGSGKTTTLYSVLNILNNDDINIVTLEDPVEYYLPGVNQSQINPDVGLTFASGLRSILRQDPDVIMVGEIRDRETADLAIHASLTGHIVLSTLHTNDAFGAIPRLVDLKVEPFLLASTLNVILAQRLVRKLCTKCRVAADVPDRIKNEVKEELARVNPLSLPSDIDIDNLKFWKGEGCPECGETGYRGRTAIAEVLNIEDEIREIISKQKDWHLIKEHFFKEGMLTLKQDGIVKALRGLTTIEEVLRVTQD